MLPAGVCGAVPPPGFAVTVTSTIRISDAPAVSVPVTVTMQAAVAELNRKNLGAVFVTSGAGLLRGIVTDGDIRRMLSTGKSLGEVTLAEAMTSNPVAIADTLMAADALSLMQRHEITVLAVVGAQGRLIGILHLHDLLGKGEFRFLI